MQSDINVFNRRLERSVRETCEVSIQQIEGVDAFNSVGRGEAAELVGSGVAGVGSVLLAGGAIMSVPAAPTVGAIIFGFITFNPVTAPATWPFFATAGLALAIGAVISPMLVHRVVAKMRQRFKNHVARHIDRALIEDDRKTSSGATREVLIRALDEARDQRLKGIMP